MSAADVSPPEVVSWDLDMNDGTVVLNFNEPVQGLTIDCTKMTFRSSYLNLNDTENITFSAYCSHPATDGDMMTVSN